MRTLKLRRPVLLLCCGFFTSSAFGQCHNASFDAPSSGAALSLGSVPAVKTQGGEQDRTVLLTLVLRKSGAVREAKVLQGPTDLRELAVHAAKHRKYKDAINSWPFSNEIMVEVTFPKDIDGAPKIRQAMPGGVPGCIYASGRVRVSPGVMQSRLLERIEPSYPAGIEKTGVLVLQLNIDKEGNVSSVEKINGPDALAPSAFDAVKKWKYRPYELNGAVVEVQTTVELKLPN
jgi:hypothetical protein